MPPETTTENAEQPQAAASDPMEKLRSGIVSEFNKKLPNRALPVEFLDLILSILTELLGNCGLSSGGVTAASKRVKNPGLRERLVVVSALRRSGMSHHGAATLQDMADVVLSAGKNANSADIQSVVQASMEDERVTPQPVPNPFSPL